ncbi:MAG: sodium:solute symporter family transporter, partial [Planctomycetota bacterium]
CWLAYLVKTGSAIHYDAAFGDSIRALLSPVLQGIMLACVMAAAMSSGDAFQVTVAGLFSQNIYRVYLNPKAEEARLVRVTRLTGIVIVLASLVVAILMRSSVVKTILDYFNILSLIGISVAMGILWRRMNTGGVFAGTILAVGAFVLARYGFKCPRAITIGVPLLAGLTGGVAGSLLTRRIHVPAVDGTVSPRWRLFTAAALFVLTGTFLASAALVLTWYGFECPRAMSIAVPLVAGLMSAAAAGLIREPQKPGVVESFFKKIYTPIGEEEKLALPLEEAVPRSKRLLTAGGLFVVKPSRQSLVGFLVTLGICVGCVLVMLALLSR